VRGRINQATETLAHRAALNAAHLLGLAFGRVFRDLRRLKDPLAEALARTKEAELSAKLAFDIVDLLSARLDKIPDRHRPYYTPSQRFRILEIKSLLGWNADLTARTFRVCPNTISNWEHGAVRDRDRGIHGEAHAADRATRGCRSEAGSNDASVGCGRGGSGGSDPGPGGLEGAGPFRPADRLRAARPRPAPGASFQRGK
jgi:hypothetical protein